MHRRQHFVLDNAEPIETGERWRAVAEFADAGGEVLQRVSLAQQNHVAPGDEIAQVFEPGRRVRHQRVGIAQAARFGGGPQNGVSGRALDVRPASCSSRARKA